MPVGHSLLVSSDPVTIQDVSLTLQEFSISADVCREPSAAISLLNRRKFDAVIVDLELGELCRKILDEVRRSSSNRTAVTFAISGQDEDSSAASREKSSFVFEKPLSPQSIRVTLKSAYGLILRERRRYFRCPATVPVAIQRTGMPELRCSSVNLSQGGMSLSTIVPLEPGERVRVQFTLPGYRVPCLAEATICWSKTSHIGVRFVSLSQESKFELQDWLSRKLEEILPDFVSRQFEKAAAYPVPACEHKTED
jgi:hypothetical protein